ncbi:MAG: hypothetical protein HYR83_14955, partial [Planctomycetes bacterium]|nr:hypothetical protein [Planctomycetota bacterium]
MNKLIPWMAATMVWAVAGTALGQSEAFTYQGQLKMQGVPLSEQVDMKFTLFDSESATTAIAGPLLFNGASLSPIQVTNGLFSAELDFGPGALQLGQWLKIEVRSPHSPNNTGTYTALTPRQKISAAPFALSVPGLEKTEAGIEVNGNVHALGEVAASAYTSNSPFIIKVNPLQMECARFDDANCFMGLGIQIPQARLHVGGVAGVDGIMFPDGSLQTTAASTGNTFIKNGTTVQPTANFNISGNGTVGSLNANGAVSLGGIAPPAAAPAGEGRIYFDSASNKMKISENSGAFVNLVGAGGVSGSGTTNTIPFWSSATTLGNSVITQNANGVQLPNGVQLAVGAQGNGISIGSPNGETGLTIAGPTGRADLRFGTFNSAETTLKLVVRGAGSGPPAE